MKLLLIEDNNDIAEMIFDFFERTGAILDYAANGTHGLALAIEGSYDCIILDLMLPGMDGMTVCQKLREQGNNTPIVMLTARDTSEDMLAGLKGGADDYVIKPFELELLEARIEAVTRRTGGQGFHKEYHCGPLRIDMQKRQVYRDEQPLKLNPSCYAILLLLAQKHPEPTSRQDIEHHLWKDEPPEEDVLRKHMYQLRKVVDKPFETQIIKTLPKVGYTLEYRS